MTSTSPLPSLSDRRSFEAGAAERVERMADEWGRLLNNPDEVLARNLHRELLAFKVASASFEMTDLHLVCQRVEELVLLAHRRRYDVPEEMFLTVSMAMEFIGFLVGTPSIEVREKADVQGFILQLDTVLQETESLPTKERQQPSSPISYAAQTSSAARYFNEKTDHLSPQTRMHLTRVATDIFLESIRAERTPALRLRESWQALQQVLTRLGSVRLKEWLVLDETVVALLGPDKLVHVTTEIQDVTVSAEIASVLSIALVSLSSNAVVHGIENPSVRTAAGKRREGNLRIEARVLDGAAILSIEDDGAGVDVAGIARAAIARGLLPPDTKIEAAQAHALMFEPEVSTMFGSSGEGLQLVYESVKRVGGSVQVRSVPGRGTMLTVTIPRATNNVEVRTFRTPNGQLLLAIEASWRVSQAPPRQQQEQEGENSDDNDDDDDEVKPTRFDPLRALGIPARGVLRSQPTIFQRGKTAYEIETRAMPSLCVATRLGPSDSSMPVEVIVVGETEALLLRLDEIVEQMSQSTVPPPSIDEASPPTPRDNLVQNASSSAARCGPQRVLLVDPDLTWLVLTRSALLHRGFAVQAVSTLAELTEALERWGPDVMLADVQNMEVPARELCQSVRRLRPLLPLILFSDANVEETESLVHESIADVSLSKKLGPDQLANEILDRCGREYRR